MLRIAEIHRHDIYFTGEGDTSRSTDYTTVTHTQVTVWTSRLDGFGDAHARLPGHLLLCACLSHRHAPQLLRMCIGLLLLRLKLAR